MYGYAAGIDGTVFEMSDSELKTTLAVVRKKEAAKLLATSIWSLDRWVKRGQFPPPLFLTPGSPAVWRVRDIAAFLEKRRRARRQRRAPRGMLKRPNEAGIIRR
jgi:predicted DNA-binding transcriptional regulator AlpA